MHALNDVIKRNSGFFMISCYFLDYRKVILITFWTDAIKKVSATFFVNASYYGSVLIRVVNIIQGFLALTTVQKTEQFLALFIRANHALSVYELTTQTANYLPPMRAANCEEINVAFLAQNKLPLDHFFFGFNLQISAVGTQKRPEYFIALFVYTFDYVSVVEFPVGKNVGFCAERTGDFGENFGAVSAFNLLTMEIQSLTFENIRLFTRYTIDYLEVCVFVITELLV